MATNVYEVCLADQLQLVNKADAWMERRHYFTNFTDSQGYAGVLLLCHRNKKK